MNHRYTENVRGKKQSMTTNMKNKFPFPETMKIFINTNTNIIVVKDNNNDTQEEEEGYDKNTIICQTAKNTSLDMAIVIELLYCHGLKEKNYFSNSTYSVEDIAISEACIRFNCQKKDTGEYEKLNFDSFLVCCKCCGRDIFTINDNTSGMDEVLKVLPDVMFCHFFKGVLMSDVNEYLFYQNIDHSKIDQCDNVNHVKFLDALRDEV